MVIYGSVTGDVTNSGVIAPGSATFSGSPMGEFTFKGNYAGAGGTMAINSFLGADDSPSDRLIISGGAATGATTVHVTNAGGPGAETTGNGIPVVNAVSGATTAPGAFALPAGELRAGAFDYDLFRGGAGGSSPNDWFLRSDFVAPPIGVRSRRSVTPPVVPRCAAHSSVPCRPAAEPAAARRRVSDHRARTRHLRRGAASGAAIGSRHPRHARRPGRRYLSSPTALWRSACAARDDGG